MELTSENVTNILKACLFHDGEDTTGHVIAEGVKYRFGFDPARLALHKADIENMIDQLPDKFKKAEEGGSSFLNACMTSKNVQWAEHSNIDELICLGLATGKISYTLPRELWQALPGSLPFLIVHQSKL